MRPRGYCIHDGCWNCKNVVKIYEYEEDDSYYCALNDTAPRPRSGSVAMGEEFFTEVMPKSFEEMLKEWDEWSNVREVMPWGCCSSHIV